MKFLKINRDLLTGMQDILSQSAGYNVGIEDELEYFETVDASSWILAQDLNGKNIAFIRHMRQGDWSLGELYVMSNASDRQSIAKALLTEFQKHASFATGHLLRFDVLKSDRILNEALIDLGFSQKRQEFLHFDLNLNAISEDVVAANKLQNLSPADVRETFENLHPVSEVEVTQWIKNGTIRASFADSKIAAAAQIYESDDTMEINRIATNPAFLRQGHARKLIDEIIIEARIRLKKRVYLKVDSEKIPAISLYRNTGFEEQTEKAQYWHSRVY